MHRFLVVAVLAGCAPATYAYTPLSSQGASPKPASCAVEVLTAPPPEKNFEQVGTLEYYNGAEPTTLDAFKKAVWSQVCEAGGDGVIAIVDDKGRYTKGTVIRYAAR